MSIEDKVEGFEEDFDNETSDIVNENTFTEFSEYILMYDPNRVLANGYKNKGMVVSKILSEKLGELNYEVKRVLENIPIIVYVIPENEEIMFSRKLEELKSEGIISSYERGGKFYALKEK